jgi:hypothetical protein
LFDAQSQAAGDALGEEVITDDGREDYDGAASTGDEGSDHSVSGEDHNA